MALVQDDILVPTKDDPELGYVRESSSQQYVPDVFYTVKITSTISCSDFCLNYLKRCLKRGGPV